jgi:hypothetical protein
LIEPIRAGLPRAERKIGEQRDIRKDWSNCITRIMQEACAVARKAVSGLKRHRAGLVAAPLGESLLRDLSGAGPATVGFLLRDVLPTLLCQRALKTSHF